MEMSEEPPVAGERSGHTVTARLKNKGFNSCTDVIMSSYCVYCPYRLYNTIRARTDEQTILEMVTNSHS